MKRSGTQILSSTGTVVIYIYIYISNIVTRTKSTCTNDLLSIVCCNLLVLLSLLPSEKISHITAVVIHFNVKPEGDPCTCFLPISTFGVRRRSSPPQQPNQSLGRIQADALTPRRKPRLSRRERDGGGRSETALLHSPTLFFSRTILVPSDLVVVVPLRPIVRIRVANRSILYDEENTRTSTYYTLVWPFAGGAGLPFTSDPNPIEQ